MVTLRLSYGSLRRVERVYSFDPRFGRGQVLARLEDGTAGEFSVNELEALDENRRLLSAAKVAREMAEEVLGEGICE